MKYFEFFKKKLNKLSSNQKISIVFVVIALIIIVSIAVPSLAKYKDRNILDMTSVWKGGIASSYRSGDGTKDNPYIISNGDELAYLSSMLKNTDYSNTYFKLENNIVLNNGVFSYENVVKYKLNTTWFYVKEYTSEFYDNEEYTGINIGSINSFSPLNNFKGHFDGNGHIIYGLYIYSDSSELGLFTNLGGTVENLHLKNSMIYGGEVSSVLAANTNNASIKNVIAEGYVIGIDEKDVVKINNNISNIERTIENTSNEIITLLDGINPINGEVISTSLSGKLEVSNNGKLYINDTLVTVNENNEFSIELGDTLLTSVLFRYVDSANSTYTLTDLKYTISYNTLVAAGITAIANNTSFEGVINKATVYGYLNAGGIVGISNGEVSLSQSYNTGNITAYKNAGGIISSISYNNKDIQISNVYNKGEVNANKLAGIISNIKVNTGNITINNTINATDIYAINTISSSSVSINNSHIVNNYSIYQGSSDGNFTVSSSLNDKDYLINTLLYNEYVDDADYEENKVNAWVYASDGLPILFIDDIIDPIATLYVNTNSWNSLGFDLSRINYDSQITFSIDQMSDLRPIKEKYYYISNSLDALSKDEINNITAWESYTDIVHINEEGFYVIYVKVVDTLGEVYYINSEVLVLDLSNPSLSISFDSYTWNTYNDTLDNIYIDKEISISLNATDSLSGVKDVSYYIASGILSIDELNEIESYIPYEDSIVINNIGSYVIYAKVVDYVGKVTYVNTDVITYGGYKLNSIYVGEELMGENIFISSKSQIEYNFTYTDSNKYKEGYTHNINTSISLPKGTKIILKDNKSNKMYSYVLDEEMNKIPFTLFNEIGSIDNKRYTESIKDGVDEDYSILFDFINSSIVNSIENMKIYVAIYDSDNVKVRTTLNSSIKSINIYNDKAYSSISSSYNTSNTIAYDSSSTTVIPLSIGIIYPYKNGIKVYDSSVLDKIIGISIKLVDKDGFIVGKEYLKNIKFSINDTYYGIDSDGVVRINLDNGINSFSDNLVITTTRDNSKLESGNYYFIINSYVSYDGMYLTDISSDTITIPVSNNTSKIDYTFDVLLDDDSRVISKNELNTKIHFDILETGLMYNPNIRVSLYKKDKLTAYDQGYSLVNISDYVLNELESTSDNIYYAVKYPMYYNGYKSSYNSFELDLVNSSFDNTGYKFVFELYDGNTLIGSIEKKVIVR